MPTPQLRLLDLLLTTNLALIKSGRQDADEVLESIAVYERLIREAREDR